MNWRIRAGSVSLDRPVIVGILNVTPDSFSDGGEFTSVEDAIAHAVQLAGEGADIIDIGGESTRPGATPISASEELNRVLPVIHGVRAALPGMPISIDTVKSSVAQAALDAGAVIVNDVSGLRLDADMPRVCAAAQAGVVLMHSRGTVADMASYDHVDSGENVTSSVVSELEQRVRVARGAGIDRDAIVLDPGIGFSKRSFQALQLLADLPRLISLGFPVLVGVSRKRLIREITAMPNPTHRVYGTVGANVAALMRGARLFRVHDVAANRQALDVAWEIARRAEKA